MRRCLGLLLFRHLDPGSLGGLAGEWIIFMELKDYIEISQSIITILAILMSGMWGYWRIIQNRQILPRANISLTVTDRQITGDKLTIYVKSNHHEHRKYPSFFSLTRDKSPTSSPPLQKIRGSFWLKANLCLAEDRD